MDTGRFVLNEYVLKRVVFGMENQGESLMLDPAVGDLRHESENDGSLIPLPSWGPTDGYRLMHSFASTLPHNVFRDRLIEILHSERGVFRRFKDAVKERPEIERLWKGYKKGVMNKIALSWLQRRKDALELEFLGPEPDDWDDLTLEDFCFRDAQSSDLTMLGTWGEAVEFEEFVPTEQRRHTMSLKHDNAGMADGIITVAESASGDIVGFSRIVVKREEGELVQVYVLPELRGFGIGRKLISMAFSKAEDEGVTSLSIRTGKSGQILTNFLKTSGFSPVRTWWRKTVQRAV